MPKGRLVALPKFEEPPNTTVPLKLLLTADEAARALSIHRSTLYELLMCGDIPSIKIGRARRIPVAWLEKWIAEQIETA